MNSSFLQYSLKNFKLKKKFFLSTQCSVYSGGREQANELKINKVNYFIYTFVNCLLTFIIHFVMYNLFHGLVINKLNYTAKLSIYKKYYTLNSSFKVKHALFLYISGN